MILAAALLFASPAAWGASDSAVEQLDWDARITDVDGDVKVYLTGDDENAIEAKKDMPLSKGDRIVTGKDGRLELAFAAENALELGSGSVLTLIGIRKADTILGLDAGRFVAQVKKLLKRRYRIRTPTSVTAVRGTQFAVEIVGEDEDMKTIVGVFDEGQLSVMISDDESKEERFLEANEEAEFVHGQPPGPVRRLDFLERRRDRLKRVISRRDKRRKRFKKYAKQNRKKLRSKMRKRRDKVRKNRKQRRNRIQQKGQDMKQRIRDKMRRRGGKGAPGKKRGGPRGGGDRRP